MGLFRTNRIKHHTKGDKQIWSNLRNGDKSLLQMQFEDIHLKTLALTSFSTVLNDNAIYCIINGERPKAIEFLRLSHLSRMWHWYGMAHEGPHHVKLPRIQEFETGQMQPNIDVHVPNLIEGIDLAIIMRDYSPDCIFRNINFDAISNRGGVQIDSWAGYELKAMQFIGIDNEKAADYFIHAKTAVRAVIQQEPRYAGLEPLFIPIFNAWIAIFSNHDEKEFNEAIKTHLLNWKADYSENSDTRNVINGYLSFRALAACCYAHDHGINITVKSDYIPEFLIRGEFPRLKWQNPEWIK